MTGPCRPSPEAYRPGCVKRHPGLGSVVDHKSALLADAQEIVTERGGKVGWGTCHPVRDGVGLGTGRDGEVHFEPEVID
ncbi:hypothetical protein FHX42_004196 [Saccharopolyspora lacisalsi]|uniref:Uncharacterized protein n=1 Tax=Halosaccharopolyspora lacisalsi TaxID=1000566 RepID=A0A839E509_9PSEU|nr:hypothetical protein [Halosaccharopolyspora lacisalsi]